MLASEKLVKPSLAGSIQVASSMTPVSESIISAGNVVDAAAAVVGHQPIAHAAGVAGHLQEHFIGHVEAAPVQPRLAGQHAVGRQIGDRGGVGLRAVLLRT